MCCDGWDLGEPDGFCEKCGTPTVEGDAATGCNWGECVCDECGDSPCDQSC